MAENNLNICLRALSICPLIFLLFVSASALDRHRAINQFHHTAWVAKDGAPSQISALAQTTDGYLWIGSALGLFRFDGVKFEQYSPPDGTSLPSQNIYALTATPDGGLWVSFRPSGLGFLKDGQIKIFTRPGDLPKSQVYSFARTPDDRVWAGTHDGLYFFNGSGWTEVGAEWNFTPNRVRHLLTDKDGTLWVSTDKFLAFLPSGAKNFQLTAEKNIALRLAQAKDGRLWQVGYLESSAWVKTVNVTATDRELKITQNAIDLLFDHEGGLWTAAYPNGIARVNFPEHLDTKPIKTDDKRIQKFNETDGLSGNLVTNILEDREGNIWVGTTKGLDRFRYSPIIPVNLPSPHQKLTLLAASNGEIWSASAGASSILRVGTGAISTLFDQTSFISSVYRAENGDVWWGGEGKILLQQNDRIKSFSQPNDLKKDWIWEVIRGNTDGGVWVNFGDVGLIYFKDGVWGQRKPPADLPERGPSASYHDAEGRTWLGYTENRVFVVDGERVRGFSSANGIEIGRIKVIRGRDVHYWFGGELGLAHFANDRFYTVRANGEPLRTVSGIIATENSDLWLNEVRGIIHIPAVEIRQLNKNPEYAIKYRLFDFEDNLPGGTQMNYTVSTAVEAVDGRLWFATDNGLAQIDPANMITNIVPPPVSIHSVSTDEKTFQSFENLRFPACTEDLRVKYTALSLSIPERVQFKYRLEGSDDHWRDAGNRRETFYTNLTPGKYRFQVIAANNDGIWNEQGADFEFEILPLFYQTIWFYFLCLITFAVLIWAGFRRRIYLVKSRLNLQFEERLAERTRIAQELHDSLLQGFISVSMQLSVAVDNLSADSPSKRHLSRILELMNQVRDEGRNTLRGLRHSNENNTGSLEQAFADIRQNLSEQQEKQADFRVIVVGSPRPLPPIIRNEAFQIGREALLNAYRHSKAKEIEVAIEYAAKHLKISVRDDGRGIDAQILKSGREGHWGLTGMRERAKKIGAQFKIWSRTAAGTEVELVIPQHVAFEKNSSKAFLKWFNHRLLARHKAQHIQESEQK